MQNLRQWGTMVLPEGKHKGKTFLETVECGYQYSMWIVKHKNLTSDWTKSFQEFVKACTGSECQGQTSSQDVRRRERCGAGADCHPIGHEVGGKDEPELARQRLPCFRGSSPQLPTSLRCRQHRPDQFNRVSVDIVRKISQSRGCSKYRSGYSKRS